MRVIGVSVLDELTASAVQSPRLRQHENLHQSYSDPCQRLLNAIEPSSYIPPHRHSLDPREELLVALRGLLGVIIFDDVGHIVDTRLLGTEKYGANVCAAIEVSSKDWHTVVALSEGAVLLETKAGPFNPDMPKEIAPWAPAEGVSECEEYLSTLLSRFSPFLADVAMK